MVNLLIWNKNSWESESAKQKLSPRQRLSVCWALPTHNSHPSLPFSHPSLPAPSLISNFPIFKTASLVKKRWLNILSFRRCCILRGNFCCILRGNLFHYFPPQSCHQNINVLSQNIFRKPTAPVECHLFQGPMTSIAIIDKDIWYVFLFLI